MLHAKRTRMARLAEREAAGEDFWSEDFPSRARVRLLHLLRDQVDAALLFERARGLILREEGLFYLASSQYYPPNDFEQHLLDGPSVMIPTMIEAFALANAESGFSDRMTLTNEINEILREERISYELSEYEMVPFSSRELHVEVVAPALRLLAASPEWDPVETAYRKALEELSRGDAPDAVTDAGTALQEALTVLGCEGNALGPLIQSARYNGVLAAHDVPMLNAIEKIANWVSADRSNSGDSHNSADVGTEDAWLIVHVVGALLVRLSKATARRA